MWQELRRYQRGALLAAIAIVIATLLTLIVSQTSARHTPSSQPPSLPTQTISVEIDKHPAVHPSQTLQPTKPGQTIQEASQALQSRKRGLVSHPTKPGQTIQAASQASQSDHTVNITIPDAALDKLGPAHESGPKWLTGPLATILAAIGAALATIIAAYIALRGVLKEAKDKWMDDRLDDVWLRFIWIVDTDRGQLLDWEQRKGVLEALRDKANDLRDPQLRDIINEWLSDRAMAIYTKLLNGEDPEMLTMIGSPGEAISAAKHALANKSLPKDIRDNAQKMLYLSKQLQQAQPVFEAEKCNPGEQGEDTEQTPDPPIGSNIYDDPTVREALIIISNSSHAEHQFDYYDPAHDREPSPGPTKRLIR